MSATTAETEDHNDFFDRDMPPSLRPTNSQHNPEPAEPLLVTKPRAHPRPYNYAPSGGGPSTATAEFEEVLDQYDEEEDFENNIDNLSEDSGNDGFWTKDLVCQFWNPYQDARRQWKLDNNYILKKKQRLETLNRNRSDFPEDFNQMKNSEEYQREKQELIKSMNSTQLKYSFFDAHLLLADETLEEVHKRLKLVGRALGKSRIKPNHNYINHIFGIDCGRGHTKKGQGMKLKYKVLNDLRNKGYDVYLIKQQGIVLVRFKKV